MNLLNFFNTFDGLPDNVDNCANGVGGAATDCRGADTQAEFNRQCPKTVAAILAMNPDVLGVNEIENDGYGPSSAMQFLVDQLNAATAPAPMPSSMLIRKPGRSMPWERMPSRSACCISPPWLPRLGRRQS